jgi:hypothetical protein
MRSHFLIFANHLNLRTFSPDRRVESHPQAASSPRVSSLSPDPRAPSHGVAKRSRAASFLLPGPRIPDPALRTPHSGTPATFSQWPMRSFSTEHFSTTGG